MPSGDTAFDAAYDAKSGAAFACANVSCHGGQTTPHWRTGTIDVNADCAKCHILGTTEYNSYRLPILRDKVK